MRQRPIPRRARATSLAAMGMAMILATVPAAACELDGLSHGYGPMSALFAGAHRYSSLNGVEDEVRDEAPPPPPPATTPPSPRRSFAAWAKVKPKPASASGEPTARWVAPASSAATMGAASGGASSRATESEK